MILPMPTVSNTSPLLNLAIIGLLDLVNEQFGEVLIPEAVVKELRMDEALPSTVALRQAMTEGWLKMQAVKDHSLVRILQRNLDGGESEAIALAMQTEAAWLLLDERDGRLTAKSLGVQVTGVLGILLRAKRQGHILSLRDTLEKLQDQAGFYIAPALLKELLRSEGES